LRAGICDIGLFTGTDTLTSLEGILEFEPWGPQSWRAVYLGGPIAMGMGVRADSGIETVDDIAGIKMASYPTYPAVQFLYMEAFLAYCNLTWDDVIPVEVGGYADGMRAVIEGAVDLGFFAATSPVSYELEASIHGVHWIPLPNVTDEDKAGWARFAGINPCFYPNKVTVGAGCSEDNPQDIWGYNYHVAAYDDLDENLAYWLTKQIYENFDAYKEKHGYLGKWTHEWILGSERWFCPWHDGSVQYFRDEGLWTDEMELKQIEMLINYPQKMTKP